MFHVFCPLTIHASPSRTAVRAQRREVGAGVRFGEALAPDVVAAQHAGEQGAFLLVGAVLDDRGRDVGEPDAG